MLPTPSTSHIPFNNSHTSIYEPSEDTFLILDTLSSESETSWLQTHFSRFYHTKKSTGLIKPKASGSRSILVIEIGTGSGVIIAFLTTYASTIFGQEVSVISLGIDMNPDACLATQQTVANAVTDSKSVSTTGTYLCSIQADLGSVIRSLSADVVVFNPPYVPTEDVPLRDSMHDTEDEYQRGSRLLALSYAGGKDGMEVTERFLEDLPWILSREGVAYLLLCRQNRPEEVKERIRRWDVSGSSGIGEKCGKWKAETVGTSGKQAGWEKLEVVRIWREYEAEV